MLQYGGGGDSSEASVQSISKHNISVEVSVIFTFVFKPGLIFTIEGQRIRLKLKQCV